MIDLHCHTNISDNSFSVYKIIKMAREQGVSHLAITDHDTTAGLKEAVSLGSEMGVEVIPGIEISAFDYNRDKKVHILGLYINQETSGLEEFCRPLTEKRNKTSYEMVELIQNAGYSITWEEALALSGGTGVYKQHIMHALIKKGYCENIYGPLYQKLFSRGGAGKKQGLAYIPLEYIEAQDAIAAVLAAGGVPVLAHPGLYDNFAAVKEFKEAGLGGIEVYHPQNKTAAEEEALALARKYDLVVTGGSDFHGFYGETTDPMGSKSPGMECLWELQRKKECP